jgi:hypothetical protein
MIKKLVHWAVSVSGQANAQHQEGKKKLHCLWW